MPGRMPPKAAQTRRIFNEDKGLTDATLEAFGIVIKDNGHVVLPYEGRLRERIDLPVPNPANPERRFVWGEGESPITPFHAQDASCETVFITEGETDCMRLWQELHAHKPKSKAGVVGLPGVESWKPEWAPRFEGAKKVYVCLDNPSGYDDPEQLERAWTKIGNSLGWDRVLRVYLTEDTKDVVEFMTKYGFPAFERIVKHETVRGKRHWDALDLTTPPEPPRWLLKDAIAYGQTTAVIGEAWGGKSFWYLGLIKAILTGEREYLGMRLDVPEDARILVFDEENPPGIPIWRLSKLGVGMEVLESGRLRYICRQGVRLDRDAAKLIDEARAQEPCIIIFDSFDRLHRLENPNQSADVSAVFTDCLMPLAQQTDAAVLFLHHENKPPQQPKTGPPVFRSFSQRSRGSGALGESADQGLIVEADTVDKSIRHLRVGGARGSRFNPGHLLCSYQIVDVDEDGVELPYHLDRDGIDFSIEIREAVAAEPDGDDGEDEAPKPRARRRRVDEEDDF